jgi:hypothetical protein
LQYTFRNGCLPASDAHPNIQPSISTETVDYNCYVAFTFTAPNPSMPIIVILLCLIHNNTLVDTHTHALSTVLNGTHPIDRANTQYCRCLCVLFVAVLIDCVCSLICGQSYCVSQLIMLWCTPPNRELGDNARAAIFYETWLEKEPLGRVYHCMVTSPSSSPFPSPPIIFPGPFL